MRLTCCGNFNDLAAARTLKKIGTGWEREGDFAVDLLISWVILEVNHE
jgi:hypothetical protein